MECIFQFDDAKTPSPPIPIVQTPSPPESSPKPLSPPPENEIIIDDYGYSTEKLLGHGAFAIVYKGRRISDSKRIAVKVISKKNTSKNVNYSKAEFDILQELTGVNHPNIVSLYGYHDSVDKFYLFMEYCNQKDLAEYLIKQGTLCEDTIKFYLRQIAEAMKMLHDKGIVHRDLKPQNILLHSNEENPSPCEMFIKIADFGLARFLGEGIMAGTMCGTSLYMAPEVLLSRPYDSKADLWSIGIIAYQCFSGGPPIGSENELKMLDFYRGAELCIVSRPDGVSDRFWKLLFGLLQPLPENRMNFNEFYSHIFMRNTKCLPEPRPSSYQSAPFSYNSYSSEFSFEKEMAACRALENEGAPASVGSPLCPEDVPVFVDMERVEPVRSPELEDDDLQVDGFVVVPTARTSSGLYIDSVYDPVHEVILPVVREPIDPNRRRERRS